MGVKLLIEIVRDALQKEGPIRVAETFEQVFYAKTVYRARGESMQAYIVRRRREFDKLGELSGSTSVSDDIKTHLLLRFSGLSMTQRTSVIASVGNVFELTKVEHALRTQFPTIHDHERPSSSSTPHGRSWHPPSRRPGKGSSSSYGVWTADEDESFFEPGFEQNDTYEAEFDEGAQEYDESYEVYEEEVDEEDIPQEDDDQETAEAYAAFVQARSAFQHRRKGKGKFKKGKGKGNKG